MHSSPGSCSPSPQPSTAPVVPVLPLDSPPVVSAAPLLLDSAAPLELSPPSLLLLLLPPPPVVERLESSSPSVESPQFACERTSERAA